MSAGVLNVVASGPGSTQMANVKRTRVLFFWNDSLGYLNAFAHPFVVLWHAERLGYCARADTTGHSRSSNPQSELRFLGLSRSGRGGRWLSHALLDDGLGDLGGI